MRIWFSVLVLALSATAASAEVVDRSAAGFEVRHVVSIAAPPARVHAALMTPSAWWSSKHSWSGSAANLSMDLATGCFCETLPKGQVRHMTVVFSDGATTLRLFGGLGPLQFTGAAGHLAVVLKPVGDATEATLTYDVGGYAKGGLAERWAGPVDGVLGEAMTRLQRYVEKGAPQ